MLIFNEFGYLVPDEPIDSDLMEMESTFIFNEKRRLTFLDLLDFLELIKGLFVGNFQVWIDGSFVTMKEFPRDLDVVVFLGYQTFSHNELAIQKIRSLYRQSIDSYFIQVFPESHFHHNLYYSDRIDWLFLFSKDRQKRKKGFLQINF